MQATVIPYSNAIPTINSLLVVANTRTTVTLQVDSSQTMKIYYVLGDCGYDNTVSFLDVYNANSASAVLNWSNPVFSALEIIPGVVNHTVVGLLAGHCYQFTFYLVSMFSVQNETNIVRTVTTAIPESSMQFTLGLRQSELLSSFEEQYLKSMSTLMAVATTRVITDYCNRTVWDSSLLWWNIILLADPTNENPNIEPAQLLDYLNRSIDSLNTYIPKLVVEPIRMSSYVPVHSSPNVVNVVTVNSSDATLSISGPQCLTLALVANIVNTSIPGPLTTFYQTSRLLKPGNQPSQFQLNSLLNGATMSYDLSNLTSESVYRVEFILWRPELEHDISSTPIVV